MYAFVLQVIALLSLAIVVLIAARALPRVREEEATGEGRKNFLERVSGRVPLEKLDAYSSSILEKGLRKLKVLVMKTDNYVDDRIGKIKKTKSDQDEKGDIREHVERIKEDKESGSMETSEPASQDDEK